MKRIFTPFFLFVFVFVSCGETAVTNKTDSATNKIPDSVPRIVRVGKEANWAYKPDTAMNELVLGDAVGMKSFMHEFGASGTDLGKNIKVLYYVNTKESEFLSVYILNNTPYRFQLKKIVDTKESSDHKPEFILKNNFITGHGIYIGMPPDYVQNMYKSQPMMQWIKGDTLYLEYSPQDKDKEHYKRYAFTEYKALYKFVDDKLRVIDMAVDPKAFEQK